MISRAVTGSSSLFYIPYAVGYTLLSFAACARAAWGTTANWPRSALVLLCSSIVCRVIAGVATRLNPLKGGRLLWERSIQPRKFAAKVIEDLTALR